MPAVRDDRGVQDLPTTRAPSAEGAGQPGPARRVRRRARLPRPERLGQDDDDPGAARPGLRRRRRRDDPPARPAGARRPARRDRRASAPWSRRRCSSPASPAGSTSSCSPRPPACPQARVEECLELVDLADRADDRFKGYSLGMKQRLGHRRGPAQGAAAAHPRRAEQRPGPRRHPRRPRAHPPPRPRRAHHRAAVLAPARRDPAGLRPRDDPGPRPLRGLRPGGRGAGQPRHRRRPRARSPTRPRPRPCCSGAGFAVSPADGALMVHAVADARARSPASWPSSGHYLEELRRVTPDLESAFLAITGDQPQDPAAGTRHERRRSSSRRAVHRPGRAAAERRQPAALGGCTASAPAASSRCCSALAVLGWIAATVIALTQFGNPGADDDRPAPSSRSTQTSPTNEQFRQQCLEEAGAAAEISPEQFCGPPLTRRGLPSSTDFLDKAPFDFAAAGHGRRPGLRRRPAPSLAVPDRRHLDRRGVVDPLAGRAAVLGAAAGCR